MTAQADPDDFDFAVSVDSPKFEGVVREVINECKRRAEREGRTFPEVAVWAHPLQIRPKGFRTSALYKIARHFRLAMDTVRPWPHSPHLADAADLCCCCCRRVLRRAL